MVSTVTVTTVTTITAMELVGSLSVLGVLLLIGFLIGKELLSASSGARQKFLARSFNISIIPLLISFAVIVALKIAEVLS